MKKDERLVRAIGDIDSRYIAEAEARMKIRKNNKRKNFKIIATVACMLIMVTAANLWLFTPYPTEPGNVDKYAGSEYYPIIEKLNIYGFKAPEHKNNFEMLLAGINELVSGGNKLSGGASGGAEMGGAGDGATGGTSYEEITDNQVEGVVEADLIKRTSTHIFYLIYDNLGVTLNAYSIAGADSSKVGSFTIESVPNSAECFGGSTLMERFEYRPLMGPEFYISPDCETAIIMLPAIRSGKSCISIISLDITEPTNISKINETVVDGSYVTSRFVDGKLILVSSFYFGRYYYAESETFVPSYHTENGSSCVPMDNIVLPESINSSRYIVVSLFDGEDAELVDLGAFCSYSEDVYVTADTVYALRKYSEQTRANGYVYSVAKTEIGRINHSGEDLKIDTSITVRGTVLDRFSIDELDGKLRVVTTINESKDREFSYGFGNEGSTGITNLGSYVNAGLYIYDTVSSELLYYVEGFAPNGESVRSARFDGDKLYVCTSVMLRDPVFFFDLSDYDNITYTDTGTISGFSTSLISFGDYLVGIGLEDWSTFKVEVYRENGDTVQSIDKYLVQYADYSTEYKSYYIDRENMLLGFGLDKYMMNGDIPANDFRMRYVLLGFDGERLNELVNVPIIGSYYNARAVYVDGYLYVFARNDFKVIALQLN